LPREGSAPRKKNYFLNNQLTQQMAIFILVVMPPRPLQVPIPNPLQVLACGAAIVTLSMGIRHGFGLWLQPITQAQGWTREITPFCAGG
jgi:hypothetical protein